MVKRNFDWEYVVIGLLTTVILIGTIFLAGKQLSDHKVGALEQEIQEIEVDQRSQLLSYQLSTESNPSCNAMKKWVNGTVKESQELRKDVAQYENSRKIKNSKYSVLKKRYMNLLVQNLLQVKRLEENCQQNYTEVVYFYSNDCQTCKDQGAVLSQTARNSNNTVIYPLDTSLNMDTINYLETKYGVEEYPALVIDEKLYTGFRGRNDLNQIIENSSE
ncbi:thioredoxin domain-containing protein [Candidatus Nanohalobium constans]|uniref:Thioredoxin domain-containing protein n=1 Tax=Candidatus Nanohalobium constans TaxID=2565781 RepID=A0A5Q0UFG8_9ARCH|nr:thioredoxin domain-containing protein [Candidatus Nanohalobium constans]QGA80111.1 thioredoxin domain-containing protein [Candidatus Nanohalobium constans]